MALFSKGKKGGIKMSTSTQVMELFNIFAETFGKEKAQIAVKDIEEIIDSRKQELATKADLREVELKLTKEIELAKSSTIKWVAGLLAAQAAAIIAAIVAIIFAFLK
jgi:hypothetical protein